MVDFLALKFGILIAKRLFNEFSHGLNQFIFRKTLFCIGVGGRAINNLTSMKNCLGMQCRLIWMPGKYRFWLFCSLTNTLFSLCFAHK